MKQIRKFFGRRSFLLLTVCAAIGTAAGCTQTLRWVNSTRTAPGDLFVAVDSNGSRTTAPAVTWEGTNSGDETYVTVRVVQVGGLPLYAAPGSNAFLWAYATVPYNAGANQFVSSSLFADVVSFTVPGRASITDGQNVVIRNRPAVVLDSAKSLRLGLRFALLDPSTGRVDVEPADLAQTEKDNVQNWALPDQQLLTAQIDQYREAARVVQEADRPRTDWKGILSLTKDATTGQWTSLARGLDSALRVFTAQLIPIQHVAFDLDASSLPGGAERVIVGKGPSVDPYVRYRYAVVAQPAKIRQFERRVIAKVGSIKPEASPPTEFADTTSKQCDGTRTYVAQVLRNNAPASPKLECGFVVFEVELRPSVLPNWAPGLVYALRCDIDQTPTPPAVTMDEARGSKACPTIPVSDGNARFSARTALLATLGNPGLSGTPPDGTPYPWYSRGDIRLMYTAVGLEWVIDSLAALRQRADDGTARPSDDLLLTMLTGYVYQAANRLDENLERRLTHQDNLILGDILKETARAYMLYIKSRRVATETNTTTAAAQAKVPWEVIGMDAAVGRNDEAQLQAIVRDRMRANSNQFAPPKVSTFLLDPDLAEKLRRGDFAEALERVKQQRSTPAVTRP